MFGFEDTYNEFGYGDGSPRGCARAMLMGVVAIGILLFMITIFTSCATSKCMPEIEYRTRDSLVYRWRSDTTYIHERDSIYVDRGRDTVLITRWREKVVEHIVNNTDTIYKDVEKEVLVKETETVIPPYYRRCSWVMWILIAMIVLYIAAKILYRIYVKR